MIPFAPVLTAAIIGGLASAMGSLIGRALIALGISYVAYSGIDALLGNLVSAIQSNSSIGGALGSWLGVLKVPTQISIYTSAFSTRVAMVTISGTFKRMVMK